MAEYICDIEKEDMYFQQYGELKQRLIRCKDCKNNTGYGMGLYSAFCMCYLTGARHKDNYYCAEGEPKDGDPNA